MPSFRGGVMSRVGNGSADPAPVATPRRSALAQFLFGHTT